MKINEKIDILLVEDNDDDADLTIRELRKNNLANKLLRVSDGEEALEYILNKSSCKGKIPNHNPKVILLDLKMPKVNGLEVLKAIRENEATRNLPVVVLTSSIEERDITESYHLGVNSYIVKPVDFVKFAQAIKEIGYYWLVLNRNVNE